MLWEVRLLGKFGEGFLHSDAFLVFGFFFSLGLVVITNDGDERPLSFRASSPFVLFHTISLSISFTWRHHDTHGSYFL